MKPDNWQDWKIEDKVEALKPKSQKDAETAARLFSVLDSAMRSQPVRPSGVDTAPKCLCGQKKIAPEEIKVATHVKGVRLVDSTCNECRAAVKGYCHIYCLGCKALVMVRPPCTTPSGLKLQSGGRYHIRECPSCSEDYRNKVGEVDRLIQQNPNTESSLRPLTAVVTLEEINYAKHMGTSPFEKLQ